MTNGLKQQKPRSRTYQNRKHYEQGQQTSNKLNISTNPTQSAFQNNSAYQKSHSSPTRQPEDKKSNTVER